MKKTPNSEEHTLLISKKAYNDFTARLRQTLNAVNMSSDAIEGAIELLDGYAKGEVDVLDSADIMVKVALMMLKPEIDKAIRRSSAARERARLRREMRGGNEVLIAEQPDIPMQESVSSVSVLAEDEMHTDASTVEIMMNRRERREYERELAREQRRYERRKLRMGHINQKSSCQ